MIFLDFLINSQQEIIYSNFIMKVGELICSSKVFVIGQFVTFQKYLWGNNYCSFEQFRNGSPLATPLVRQLLFSKKLCGLRILFLHMFTVKRWTLTLITDLQIKNGNKERSKLNSQTPKQFGFGFRFGACLIESAKQSLIQPRLLKSFVKSSSQLGLGCQRILIIFIPPLCSKPIENHRLIAIISRVTIATAN